MNAALTGVLILVVAGVVNGSFTLPMKFTRLWAWENTWLVYTVIALLIFPPLLAILTIPGLGHVYSAPGASALITVAALCGAAWGIGQFCFGLAVEDIGIALTFSIILGLSAAIGTMLPLLQQHPEELFQSLGLKVMAGVLLVLVGIALCAVAGRGREAERKLSSPPPSVGTGAAVAAAPARESSLMRGLGFCLVAGVGSGLQNFGFSQAHPLIVAAQAQGASATWATYAAWLPNMMAGGIPGVLYCAYLVRKNRTGNRFRLPGTGSYWFLAAVMAVFWFGSTSLYGIGAGVMGDLGTVLGWPVFMSLIVIVANILGVLTGEWKGISPRPQRWMYSGLAVLILAIVVLSRAS